MVCNWTVRAPPGSGSGQRVLANVTRFNVSTTLPNFCVFDAVHFEDPVAAGADVTLCGPQAPLQLLSSSSSLSLQLSTDVAIRASGVTVQFTTLPACTTPPVLTSDADAFEHVFPTTAAPGPCGWVVAVPYDPSRPTLRAFLQLTAFSISCPSALLVRVGGPAGPVLWPICGDSPPLTTPPLLIPPTGLQLYLHLTAPIASNIQVGHNCHASTCAAVAGDLGFLFVW